MKRAFAIVCLCTMLVTSAAAGYDEGLAAYHQGEFATALRLLRPIAEEGDARAQFRLGLMYDHGKGVPADISKARKWYRMAAERGLPVAQNKLGFLYAEGKGVRQDYVEALKWYKRSADQGNVIGKAHLLRIRFKAVIQKAELHRARSVFRKGIAAYELGDYATVLQKWRPLAEQGHAYAQEGLGRLYRYGQGVTQDFVQSYKWYSLAAAQGNEAAREHRDVIANYLTKAETLRARKLTDEWLDAFWKQNQSVAR